MVDIKKSAIGGLISRGGGGGEGAKLTNLPNFCTFLNWYFICYKIFALFSNGTICFLFSHFAELGGAYRFQSHVLHQYLFAPKSPKGGYIFGGLNPLGGYKNRQ